MVGVARFELATSRPPDARATKLRYTPKRKHNGDKLTLVILMIYRLNAMKYHQKTSKLGLSD